MSLLKKYFIDTLEHRYADFSGRARRSEFWYYNLFYFISIMILYCIVGIGYTLGSNIMAYLGMGLVSLASLAMFIPTLAIAIRRLHDTGKSGWMILLGLIPMIGPIILLVFMVTDSQRETNQWGPDPKEGESIL